MASFNYGNVYGMYADAKDYLNSLSRGIPNYVVAQNIGKLSPFMRKLLANATVKDISYPFVSQPVVSAALDNTQKVGANMQFTISSAIQNDNIDMATFYANLAIATIVVTDFEVKAYESGNPDMLFNAVAVRASQVYVGMMEKLRTWFTGSRVTPGNPPTEDTDRFYGLKDAVDNGTTNANYGNINRTTNTWWNSYIWNAQTLFGTGLEAYKYVMYALSKFQNNVSSMGMPDIGFTSYGVWAALATSLTSMERIVVGDVVKFEDTRQYEVTGLALNGVPIFPDPSIDDNAIYFLNMDHFGLKLANGYALSASDWKPLDITGKLAYLSYLLFGGQLISDAPISCFALTNMPAINNI